MNKALSLALVLIGIILLILGFSAMESFGSQMSEFFTGQPSDRAVWMLLGGALALFLGGLGVARSGRV